MAELNPKVALVTGGSRGIGAAICRRLAQGGADVAFTYVRDESRGKAVIDAIEATGRRSWARQLDAANAAAVQQIVDEVVSHFGRLDILVNNAGMFPSGALENVTVEEVDRTLAVLRAQQQAKGDGHQHADAQHDGEPGLVAAQPLRRRQNGHRQGGHEPASALHGQVPRGQHEQQAQPGGFQEPEAAQAP